MTEGNIITVILIFAFPIFLGNIFQQLYNVVDTAVIGNVLGDDALAAVGASAALYGLVIGFSSGITNGFSVVLARFFGAKDEEKMRESVAWIYVLTVVIGGILTALSLIFLHPILEALKTPDNLISRTDRYLRIILAFSLIIMIYNMFSGILRAIGNSRVPLYFLIISSVLNAILDYVFVKNLGLGIAGAAYATIIAMAISAVLCAVYIWLKCPMLHFSAAYLKWDPALLKELLTTGFSMGLMLVVVSIGSVALQRAVNSLGETIMTAHTAARKLDDVFMLPLGTLSMASSTFASQNLGAGKYDRVQKGIKQGILLAMGWSLISIVCVFCFGRSMIHLLTGTSNQEVIKWAFLYIRINIAFFMALGVLLILRSSLQGIGRKLVPVLGSVVELALKFAAAVFVADWLGYFGICILEPVIWIICALMVFLDFYIYFRKLPAPHS